VPESSGLSRARANSGDANLQPESYTLLIFSLSDRLAAFSAGDVERVTPMAELAQPPGLPPALEGLLNLGGDAVPVLRLDRLFGLAPQCPGLYSMLIVLRSRGSGRIAILADRVSEILSVPNDGLRPISQEDAFNGCAEAIATIRHEAVHLLSPDRIILANERLVISQFRAMEQARLEKWTAGEA
jgi:purine-binding chemotaxis protein CheW